MTKENSPHIPREMLFYHFTEDFFPLKTCLYIIIPRMYVLNLLIARFAELTKGYAQGLNWFPRDSIGNFL